MNKLKIELWLMPDGQTEKIKMITVDNQLPTEAFLPDMQYALTDKELEKLTDIMISHVGYPCELYKQGMFEQLGILKSYNKNTLEFIIE